MLNSIAIESDQGFELGIEITVKAHFKGFRVGEIPCVWTDRLHGESRFKLMKWLPLYIKWYRYALMETCKRLLSPRKNLK